MPTVKYRLANPKLNPRRTRIELPGWAGKPEPRVDGAHEYPWHCIPFSEAAKGGIELAYPHDNEFRVSRRSGELMFEELLPGEPESDDDAPPFRDFGGDYFTYQIQIDLKVDPGLAVKAETHPRFYTDTTGTVPIAVPAVIRHWWPMIHFVVFKSPGEGQTHVFRPGEPFMLFTVVDAEPALALVPMPEEEAAEREMQSRRIHASRATLGTGTTWTSSTRTVFDGTYRRIHGAAKAAGD